MLAEGGVAVHQRLPLAVRALRGRRDRGEVGGEPLHASPPAAAAAAPRCSRHPGGKLAWMRSMKSFLSTPAIRVPANSCMVGEPQRRGAPETRRRSTQHGDRRCRCWGQGAAHSSTDRVVPLPQRKGVQEEGFCADQARHGGHASPAASGCGPARMCGRERRRRRRRSDWPAISIYRCIGSRNPQEHPQHAQEQGQPLQAARLGGVQRLGRQRAESAALRAIMPGSGQCAGWGAQATRASAQVGELCQRGGTKTACPASRRPPSRSIRPPGAPRNGLRASRAAASGGGRRAAGAGRPL